MKLGGRLGKLLNAPGFHRPALRSLALGYLLILVILPAGGLV